MRKIFFVFFFLFLLISFTTVKARDYAIPSSTVTFEIEPDGRVLVHEKIEYILYGYFNELYLSKPKELAIYNASGYCENVKCSFRTEEPEISKSGGRELILSLVTGKCDSHPIAHFFYEVHPIILCNDTARFYYQLWGMEWNKPTDLTATIILPETIHNKQYYIHPWDLRYSVLVENETSITFKSKQDPGVPFEIDMLLPRDTFENSSYVTISDYTSSSIISFEEKSRSDAQLAGIIIPIISILIIIFPILLFIICYIAFGREKPVFYIGVYEREPPSQHTPAEVSTLLNQFRVPPSAFIATVLNFVYKGYLEMSEITVEKQGLFRIGTAKTLLFKKDKKPEKLKPHEQKVYDYICQNMKNGSVDSETLKKRVSSSEFSELFSSWKETVLRDLDRKKYLEIKGLIIFTAISLIYSILCLVLLAIQVPTNVFQSLMIYSAKSLLTPALITGVLLPIPCLVIAIKWKTILSRWTEEGRLLELKWENFKKFISDFTLLKEHPPASIVLWDFYMVYAVALGVAEHTIKAMKDIVPDEEIKRTRTGSLVYSTVGFSSINSFTISVHSASSGGGYSGGGTGGFHGGGGGGGGAR